MNIKILDSWLRDYLETKEKPHSLAEKVSLTSASIERIEEYKNDKVYDIEVTTNRPDLMSVVGLAREAAAVLSQFEIQATFTPPVYSSSKAQAESRSSRQARTVITIENDPKLVNRVCAVVMEVQVKPSPEKIRDRLESSDIRSLNNLIDITNYVMRTIGHPTHVFDFDRLATDRLIIKESKKGEVIETLDSKKHTLPGGDVVAVDTKGRIIDLLGIMGLENSVVTDETKRILFFVDNNNPEHMRKTSMSLGIRTEAAQLNEKGIDPELAMDALLYGIQLYEEYAAGKVVSEIIDIYPNKPKTATITVTEKKISTVIGIPISLLLASDILTSLSFATKLSGNTLSATVPSYRIHDVRIEEDLIEEIARIYGYHNLPSVLPAIVSENPVSLENDPFYWEGRVKHMLKYWGFIEAYTYSMVSEKLYEGPIEGAVVLQNPLDEEHIYMRKTLVPSLLEVLRENSAHETVSLFEIANVYEKKEHDLPEEKRMLAGILKKPKLSFYEVKGIVEQLGNDLGIMFSFKPAGDALGADVFIGKERAGTIEELDDEIVDFELDFELLFKYATLKKTYQPINKYPPILEDLSLIVPENISTGDIIDAIKKVSPLVSEITLLDKYKDSRTVHIVYRDPEKNLTNEAVAKVRQDIIKKLHERFDISVKA